ncbi:unnamed protein product [Cylicocyclus nassatus]|uniref:Uncharacterized protein n=1 Tax=Cylicocyclus nassatus TaxID=53992 RepID=A0AA36HEJ5_CYLNA|nr:unnamed protein product [Cylicocyclus nassatus]
MPARSNFGSSSQTVATRALKKKKVADHSENLAVDTPDVDTVDFDNRSVGEIIETILDRNTDPLIEKLVMALKSKMPKDAETEKRERSIVLSGLPEAPINRPLLERKQHLEENVARVLEQINVDCWPCEIFRMGKFAEDLIAPGQTYPVQMYHPVLFNQPTPSAQPISINKRRPFHTFT